MMQVSETRTDGLKRELKVTVPASELEARLSKRLDELKGRIRLNGFRPGKVPIGHIRKVYGKAAMAEVVEALVGESTEKALSDRGEKVSMRPRVDMAEEVEADRILSGDADLSFTMAYEVLPEFEVADYKGIHIERPVAPIADEEVDARLKRIAEGARSYSPVERPAEEGDRVTFSFVGKIDGKEFEGGTQEDANVVIGSGMLIGGLEDGLRGVSAGEEKTIEATFPETYPVPALAGKPATFEVKVKEVSAPEATELDDEVAKRLGMESLDKLRDAIRGQIENEQGLATRQKVKRQLLDALDDLHSFPLPSNLVDQEFENIWRQVAHAVEHHGHKFEDEGTTEEEARGEYRKIAERRVRLGLVLSRIGEGAGIQVTEEELQRALYAQMRRFPGQEQQVIDFYRNDAGALQGLRAPIYEEKVVDHILEQADVTDKNVTREELMADLEDEDEHVHHHQHEHEHEAHAHDHEAHADDHHDHHGHDHDHGDHDHGEHEHQHESRT